MPGFDSKELNKGQIAVVSYLVKSCECFAVGHEFGHIIISKTKNHIPEYEEALNTVEDFLNPITDLTAKQKSEFLEPWAMELCADHIGLQLSLGQPKTKQFEHWGAYKEWLCAGAEISRELDLMRQEFDDRLTLGNKVTFTSSHPHDFLRLKAIRASPEYTANHGESLLSKYFSTFTGILDSILEKKENGKFSLVSLEPKYPKTND